MKMEDFLKLEHIKKRDLLIEFYQSYGHYDVTLKEIERTIHLIQWLNNGEIIVSTFGKSK
jgi:hypothetical protein